MRQIYLKIHFVALLWATLLAPVELMAQVSIFANPITGTNPNTSNPYTTGQTFDANLTVSGIGRGSGIGSNDANNRYNANGWNSTSLNTNDYFEFTLTPASGFTINFNSFVYTGQASGTGPTSFAFRSSVDAFAANIGTPTSSGTTISLSASAYQGISSAITFRIYAWGASASGGTFSINSFDFTGTVVSSSPTLTATPTSRSGFTYTEGAGPSAEQNFVLTSANLTTADVTVSTTTNYEISTTSGSGFSTSSITLSGSDRNGKTIFIRQKSGLSVGTYTGTITVSGGGAATNATVSLSGSVTGSYRWDRGAGTNNWADANNWNANVVPGAGDQVLLDNSLFDGAYTVVLPTTAVSVASIEITPGSGTHTITLELPSGNTQNPGLDFSGSGLTISDRGVFNNFSGATSGTGVLDGITANLITIKNGGKFVHALSSSSNGANANIIGSLSSASGTENGTFEINHATSSTYFISLPGRTFGNLTLKKTSGTGQYQGVGSTNPVTINGNLTIETGATFAPNLDNNIIVKGNLVINGTFSWNPFNATGTENLVLSGTNQSISGSGTWTVGANVDNINVQGSATLNRNLTLNSGNTLLIDNTGSFTVASGQCVDGSPGGIVENNGTLSIQDGGSIIPGSSGGITGSGTFNVTRTGQGANKYTYWASPMLSQNASLLGSTVYRYVESTNSADYRSDYQQVTGNLSPGVGYAALGSGTVTFTGSSLFSSNEIAVLSVTGAATGAENGWNLLGNYFPAAISASSFLTTNSSKLETSAIYIWSDDNSGGSGYTSADFAVLNPMGTAGGGGLTPAGYIPSCQGFFVKALADGEIVSFNRSQLQCANTQFFRTEAQRIRLVLSAGKKRLTSTMVGFADDATDGADREYDAPTFGTSMLATMLGDRSYAIQGLPTLTKTRTVALAANFPQGGTFSINTDIFEIPQGFRAVLEDRLGFAKVDLAEVSSYEFDARPGKADGRFFLHFVPLSGEGVTALDHLGLGFDISTQGDQITLRFESASATEIQIVDINGRTVRQYTTSEPEFAMATGLNGLFIVRVSNGQGIQATKVLLGK